VTLPTSPHQFGLIWVFGFDFFWFLLFTFQQEKRHGVGELAHHGRISDHVSADEGGRLVHPIR
jgi:hypothetical protein